MTRTFAQVIDPENGATAGSTVNHAKDDHLRAAAGQPLPSVRVTDIEWAVYSQAGWNHGNLIVLVPIEGRERFFIAEKAKGDQPCTSIYRMDHNVNTTKRA